MTATTPDRAADSQDNATGPTAQTPDTRTLDDALKETLGDSPSLPAPPQTAPTKASAKAAKDPATAKAAKAAPPKATPKVKAEAGATEDDVQRELEEAVAAENFVMLSDVLKEDAGGKGSHRAALHRSYLQAVKARRIFGVPLSTTLDLGEDGETAPDEMVAKTPTFLVWRDEASCEYYAAQMQQQPEFGVETSFAEKHFLTLATARTITAKSSAKTK